jgi:hypothetical protein
MARVSDRSVGRRLARAESKCTLPGGTHPSWSEYRDTLHDLLDSRAECAGLREQIERQRPVIEAVSSIVDSLDDPPSGLTWDGEPQETCAAELERIRAALVPAVLALDAKEE